MMESENNRMIEWYNTNIHAFQNQLFKINKV